MPLLTEKLKFCLFLTCFVSLSLHASWWWPFGSKEPEKPAINDIDKRPPIKVLDHAPSKEDTVSVERLRKMAKDGNSNAQLALGKIYFEGLVKQKQDYDKAFELFMQSANQGNAQAMFNVGLCYDGGFGTRKNLKEALRWYYQAADAGVPEAQINAAIAAEQRGDYEKALHYLKMRANAGDTAAMNKVASFLLNGLGTPENPQEAVSYLLEASRRGNSRAQVRLADCYQRGVGVERNYMEMFNWLTLAAQDGDPEAQAKLGYCYQKGLGITANAELAFTWFKTAASAAYGPALVHLGDCYRYGDGIACDLKKAFECYRAAAEQGEAIGAFNLAIAFSDGIGTPKAPEEACKWMRKAAEQNLVYAQIQLGIYLQKGYGCGKPDTQGAFQWFQKAALQNEPMGMIQVALCLLQGTGTAKNPQEARQWLSKAAAAGSREAITLYAEHFGKEDNKD